MKLTDIKTGMILTNRAGHSFIIFPFSGTNEELYAYSCENSSRSNLNRWTDNLFSRIGDSDDDIVEVQAVECFTDIVSLQDIPAKSIWKRPNTSELLAELEHVLAQAQELMNLL